MKCPVDNCNAEDNCIHKKRFLSFTIIKMTLIVKAIDAAYDAFMVLSQSLPTMPAYNFEFNKTAEALSSAKGYMARTKKAYEDRLK